jgi:hypothetical protein
MKWNYQLKYQRGFIFNGFRPNSQRWKYAILTNIFYRIRINFAHFLSIWHEEDIIQQLKAWSFRMWKNLVHTQSNSDTIARWSSITFFFIHPVYIRTFSCGGPQTPLRYDTTPNFLSPTTIPHPSTLVIVLFLSVEKRPWK